MTSGFGLVVRFELRDEASATGFDELVSRTVPQIEAQEPGTLAYVVHTAPDDPKVRVFYELYADRAAFDAHEQQPHTKHFLAQREQYLTDVQVTFIERQTGKGPAAA
ncbi:putative quinol monooxygenase [Phaeacidiphilus oryzae]|uniref:putative quinol monooxygenase n=1 Tax=Phaeacidiphilus oryzae TaxID=348818 RepID=UPI00056AEFF5|nr:antibiotic biosynthesis monooxygenase [Phaeacidiphilus oryzae]